MMTQLRIVIVFLVCFAAVVCMATGAAFAEDEAFINAALDPTLHRDAHGTGLGISRTESANTEDGQSLGISFSHVGVASNLWNNEHNQVFFGVEYGSRTFDNNITLPSGIILPDRVDRASGSLVYKHITSGDVSLVQAIQLSRTSVDDLSGPSTQGVDLIGLATVSHEPGYVWLYGYAWTHVGNEKFTAPIPLIEYFYGASETFSYFVGFPLFGLSYSPHPDWWLGLNWALGGGPSAAASYKVSSRNYANLAYGDNGWGYRLAGPVQQNIAYTAHTLSLNWAYLPFYERRRAVSISANISRDLDRRIGSDKKRISMDDATTLGFNIGFGF